MCSLSDNIYDYPTVSQGKLTIPNVDDGEELELTDVSKNDWLLIINPCLFVNSFSHSLKNQRCFVNRIVWYDTPNAITN